MLRYRHELALCFVTMLWGATFLIIRNAMEHCGPLWFVGLRTGTAALVLLLVSFPILRETTARELRAGLVVGFFIFLGFALQTAGLATLDASKSAFLTAFYVPLVPLLERVFMGHPLTRRSLAGLTLAFAGVILLTGGTKLSFSGSPGECLTLLCSLLFALEIVFTGIFAPGCNARRMTLIEMTVISVLSFVFMPVTGETVPAFSWYVTLSACALGAATALIQFVIVWAQKVVPPTRATLIYTTEPVWGGFFGALAGERMTASALAGCGLILSGILTGIVRRTKPLAAASKAKTEEGTAEQAGAGSEKQSAPRP
ncbi:MAG: DMT family transporter [Desulfovibrionaceae bacterium]|nr:DMT family transporter [Desulfovibrionaceae bacterium]